jgi:tetratricopeptide (TPR) repeat protein
VLGKEHPDTLTSVNNLAVLLYSKGDYEGAQPLYERAMEARERVLGKEHPDTLASLNNLAFLLLQKGDYEGSEVLLKKTLYIYENLFGNLHSNTAYSLYNLGYMFFNKGDGTSAVTFYQRALDIYEKIVGAKIEATPHLLSTMAICHNQVAFHNHVPNMNWEKAEKHYLKAMELFDKTGALTEAINAELNLQIMYHISGQKYDLERIKEITRKLEETGDIRAEKGHKLLREL